MKKFKFSIDDTSYNVNVKTIEGNKAEIEVNGKNYSVTLEQEVNTLKTPIIVRKEVQSNPGENKLTTKVAPVSAAKRAKVNSLKAPLPGSIIRLAVKVGDIVKVGDLLLVMESMKMENNILSEKDGEIKSIAVVDGQAVMTDDDLMVIE